MCRGGLSDFQETMKIFMPHIPLSILKGTPHGLKHYFCRGLKMNMDYLDVPKHTKLYPAILFGLFFSVTAYIIEQTFSPESRCNYG